MDTILLIALGLGLAVLVAIGTGLALRSAPVQRRLTPVEELEFETVKPDYVTYAIEQGVEHPDHTAIKVASQPADHEPDYKAVRATVKGLLKGGAVC